MYLWQQYINLGHFNHGDKRFLRFPAQVSATDAQAHIEAPLFFWYFAPVINFFWFHISHNSLKPYQWTMRQ